MERCFNPLSAVKPRDIKSTAQNAHDLQVSIRSRRLSREIYFIITLGGQRVGFNPLSAVKPRDIKAAFRYSEPAMGFNPLSAVKPRDMIAGNADVLSSNVSIRSRRLSREIYNRI